MMEIGASPVVWREAISSAQALQESLFLGLRLTEGVDWAQLQSMDSNGTLKEYKDSIDELCSSGLMEKQGRNFRLTTRGMLLSNEVFQVFV